MFERRYPTHCCQSFVSAKSEEIQDAENAATIMLALRLKRITVALCAYFHSKGLPNAKVASMHRLPFKNLVLVMSISSSIISCGGGFNAQPPPPRNCSTADECAESVSAINTLCGRLATPDTPYGSPKYGPISPEFLDRQWQIYNMHSSRDIVVNLETTIDRDPPLDSIIKTVPVIIYARDSDGHKGPVVGGPDRIDHGGPGRLLGCEWAVVDNEHIEKRSFRVKQACFTENDPACVISPPYQKPEPPRPPVDVELGRCDTECATGDETRCSIYDLRKNAGANGVSRELTKIYRDLTGQHIPPIGVDASPLINLLTSGGALSCGSRLLAINEAREATLFGSVCHAGLPIPKGSPATLKAIALMIPNSVGGQFSQLPLHKPFSLARIQMEMQNTASVEYYDATGPNGENVMSEDRLVAMLFSQGKIMIAGEKKYCSVINFNEFGD